MKEVAVQSARMALLLSLLLLPIRASAQARDEIWRMREDVALDGLLYKWNPAAGVCGDNLPNAKLGGFATVVIFKTSATRPGEQGNFYVIVLQNNNSDDGAIWASGAAAGYAEIRSLYCIKETALRDNFELKEPFLAGGVLSVPFKLRFGPTKVMAGGALGAYVGHNIHHSKDIASTPLVFASLTTIPLNDMNEKVPQTQLGLGVGAGWVVTIPKNFQFGVVVGWDIFSRPTDWPYSKFSPWISLSIGYSFTSPQKQNSDQAAATALNAM